jgi:hypothetical protein
LVLLMMFFIVIRANTRPPKDELRKMHLERNTFHESQEFVAMYY